MDMDVVVAVTAAEVMVKDPAARCGGKQLDSAKDDPAPARCGGQLDRVGVPLGMVAAQLVKTAMLLLFKLSLNDGMPPFVLITYRSLIGAAAVAPIAVVWEREMITKVNLVALGWICVSAILGVPLANGLFCYGLRDTSATYAVNVMNMLPIVTFIMAIALRTEKLALNSWPGKVKLVSTAACVGGMMLVSSFRGELLHLWPTHLLKTHGHAHAAIRPRDMIAGTLFLCGSCLSYAVGYSVQARLSRAFPSKYLATTMICLLGGLQSVAIGLVLAPGKSAWKLKWDLQLLTVVFSGVLGSGVTYVLNLWAIARRGPIYPTMFNSLSLILTTAMDSVLLGTDIYLGSVLGTLLIILGLYAFLWGQAKELAAAAATPVRQSQVQANNKQAQSLVSQDIVKTSR